LLKKKPRKAVTGQAGTAKRAAGDAKRWAATGQADKDKHAGVEAARKAATGQAGTVKRGVHQAEDEEEGGVHQDDSGGGEDTGAVDYAVVEVDVDRDGDTGDYLCLFTATAPRTRFQFSPRFEFNRAASLRAAQLRAALIAQRKSRRAIAAAQFAPRSRADTPRQFFHAQQVVPLLLTPRPCSVAPFEV